MLELVGHLSKGVFCAGLIWLGHVSSPRCSKVQQH